AFAKVQRPGCRRPSGCLNGLVSLLLSPVRLLETGKRPYKEDEVTMVKLAWRFSLVAVLVSAVYVTTAAGWSYYATREAVDTVLREAARRYRTPLATETFTDTMGADVRERVMRGAGREGFHVQERDVLVSARGGAISATVHYSYPVIRYGDKDIL